MTNIGQVTINPIYHSFDIKKSYSEITLNFVYPNGDPARERSQAIEDADAAKESRTYKASAGGKLNSEGIKKIINQESQKGHFVSAKSKGKDILKAVFKTIHLSL